MGASISRDSDHIGNDACERHRKLASEYAAKRGKCFEDSRAAYQRRDGALAKELSNKGKEYGRLMEHHNELARKALLQANHAHRPPNELDLHGLYVKEALAVTRKRLDQFIRNKEQDLIIIVGKGNRSVDGIAKIKPEVTKLMHEYRVKATPNKPNEGCIYVEPITDASGKPDYSWIDAFFAPLLQRLVRFLRTRR